VDDYRYIEVAPAADIADHVQSVWIRRVSSVEAEQPARILPDGCMDLIWVEREVIVAGPDTVAWIAPLAAGEEIVGVRFYPGVAPSLLRVPASELVSQRVEMKLISRDWAEDLHRRLGESDSALAIGEKLQASLRARLGASVKIDRAVQHVATRIWRSDAEVSSRVNELANAVGLSERQLNRRCHEALGYGPKMLARIIRFQRFLSRAEASQGQSIPWIAGECGYADQSHLTREVKELSGLPPVKLLAERRQLQSR
jgi:AraC-like DNA-binding protein